MNYIFITIFLLMSATMHSQNYSFASYDQHASQLQKAQIENLTMAYIDQGEGPVIVLIHGIPTNSWLYRKMINPLVEKGYRVIVPDMMGAGQSSKPSDPNLLNFEAQSSHLHSLLKHLQVKSASLVVHDAGGPWSWNLLAKKDHPIKKVVLLNTILYPEGFNPPVLPKNGGITHRTLRWAYGIKWISKIIIGNTLKNGLTRVKLNDKDKEGYFQGMAKVGRPLAGTFFGSLRQINQPTAVGRQALKEQSLPMLAIWGEKDEILMGNKQLPLAMRDLNLDKKNVHMLVGCNHFIQEEAPQEIVDYIVAFLK